MFMSGRFDPLVRRVREAVLTRRGATDTATRAAVEGWAAALGGKPDAADPDGAEGVPEPVKGFVGLVARHAYRVKDSDVEALRSAGYGEDAIFELTVSAAVGAGCGRLERGLSALKGEV